MVKLRILEMPKSPIFTESAFRKILLHDGNAVNDAINRLLRLQVPVENLALVNVVQCLDGLDEPSQDPLLQQVGPVLVGRHHDLVQVAAVAELGDDAIVALETERIEVLDDVWIVELGQQFPFPGTLVDLVFVHCLYANFL